MIVLFTFFAVMAVSIVLFAFWTIAAIVRFVAGLVFGFGRSKIQNNSARSCMNPGCRTTNPLHARFCRRCGAGLIEVATNRQPSMLQPRYNPQNGRGRQAASV